ncbi:family 20 glycosylhydrolase [Streptosporangium pseudovulgare]|uniref:beta-N-acetylhexosaminidase n=1 Tax=Streptosporangium pseudovulgare TaxID=35765 RepID=A0ABQ2QLY0_9ACTN|nr:family 20 glycosylhydrolase [Streptosporangium pseudovulgare]GGP87727.1 hypothetical protein GCM10010140_16420 [Streptosporangium pseudovulgare]
MVVTRSGTIVASYDGRHTVADLPSNIDNLVRISRDGGNTWSAQRVNRSGEYPAGFGDPSLAYNPATNRIFLFYAASLRTGFVASRTGTDHNDPYVVQADYSYSDDDGQTWKTKRITDQVKDPSWGGIFASSGRGLYVSAGRYKGRIVQQYNVLKSGQVYAVSAWTDDNGETWHHGDLIGPGTNENKVTDTSTGDLLLNVRANPYRLRAVSTDGGRTYSPLTRDTALRDPNDNGSIMRAYPNAPAGDPRSRWLISTNNDDPQIRMNTTVRLSCDDGQTWPISKVLDPGASAYSTADMLADGQVGVLYEREGYAKITFASFPVSELDGLCAPIAIPAGTALTADATTIVPVTVTNQQNDTLPAGAIALGGLDGVSGTAATPAVEPGRSITLDVPVRVGKDVPVRSIRLTGVYTAGGKSSTTVQAATIQPPAGPVTTVYRDTATHAFTGRELIDVTPDLAKVRALDNGSVSVTFTTTNANQTLPQVLFGASRNGVDDHEFLITINSGGRPYFEIRPSRAQGYLANHQSQVNVADGREHTVELRAGGGQTTFWLDGVKLYTAPRQVFFSALTNLENMTLGGVHFKTGKDSAPTDQWFFTGTISEVRIATTAPPASGPAPAPAVKIEPVLDVYRYNAPPGLGIKDQASYMVRVTNTGNVPLTSLTTTGNIDLSGCASSRLAPGDDIVCRSRTHTFTQNDVDARAYTPSVTVNATADGRPFTASDTGGTLALPAPFQLPPAPAPAPGPVDGCGTPARPVGVKANSEESFAHYGAEDTPATNVIDGNSGTFWSSGWSYGTREFPNAIVLDLGASAKVCALNYLPRQSNTNGNIGDYRVYVSDAPDDFGEPVVGGAFVSGTAAQTVYLPKAKNGRYVKLAAYGDIGANNTQTTTAAELSVRVVGRSALPAVIPAPTSMAAGPGPGFELKPDTPILTDAATREQGAYLASILAPATGFHLAAGPMVKGVGKKPAAVTLSAAGSADLGEQGYTLTADHKGVLITGHTAEGVFNGVQTLRQLLPPQINAPTVRQGAWTVPAVRVSDTPRFPVRGAMLDVGRRFYPVTDVKRLLDHMAAYKLNSFHFHLTEDQGWRIAIDAYPALTQVGGSGQSGIKPGTVDNGVAGPWFYTKEQYREIVDYAKARFIQVIPEIDGPGHMGAAMASVAGLNCNDTVIPVYTAFNRGPNLCLKDDRHLAGIKEFLTAVLADVAGQNPTSDYIHVGGDEADGTPNAQYRAYTEIANQAVAAAGKKVMAWNTWASGEALPEGAVLHNYGQENGELGLAAGVRTALANGNRILMSPADHTYLDIKYDSSVPYGLTWIQGRYLDLARAYRWDPNTVVPDPDGSGRLEVSDEQIYGVELALWADATNQNGPTTPWSDDKPFDPVSKYMDTMLFPRLPAVAEVAWSARLDRQGDPSLFEDFQSRVAQHALGWEYAGIRYYRAPDVPWLPAVSVSGKQAVTGGRMH